MSNGVPCELQIAICKTSYAANMVCPINELADLPKGSVSLFILRTGKLSTLTMVRSQFESILLERLIKARGTIHSFTEGGLG